MKRFLVILGISTLLAGCGSSKKATTKPLGFIATVQMDEELDGICDNSKVYHLNPIFGEGQVKAVCPLSDDEMTVKFNAVSFLVENTSFNGEGMLGAFINCEGKLIQGKIDNSTGNESLDKELEVVLNEWTEWTPGKLDGKSVDSHILISFKIEEGTFSLK